MNTDKKLIVLAVALLILMGVVGAVNEYRDMRYSQNYDVGQGYAGGVDTDGYSDPGVVCTADAQQCPDGTYVGRTGPRCEFVCPGATSTAATSTPSSGPLMTGQLVGTVMLGPTCPVVRNPPDPQCADKPYQTTVVVATQSGKEVGRQMSDTQGRFAFSFLPGTYTVSALGGMMLPRCGTQTVILQKAATTTVALSCDTGIR